MTPLRDFGKTFRYPLHWIFNPRASMKDRDTERHKGKETKTESVKAESVKTEDKKTEFVKTEDKKTERHRHYKGRI